MPLPKGVLSNAGRGRGRSIHEQVTAPAVTSTQQEVRMRQGVPSREHVVTAPPAKIQTMSKTFAVGEMSRVPAYQFNMRTNRRPEASARR